MNLALGDTVSVRMTKWGDRPHWSFESVFLGRDEHGTWLGFPRGTHMTRPGADYVSPTDQLGLVPADTAPDAERWWLATIHKPDGPLAVYIDVTAPPTWSGSTLTAIDLDLDVVREHDGRVWVDDEEEFAEHQALFSYPPDVVAAARASCDRLVALLGAGHPPYDGTPTAWFDRLASLG